MSHIRLDHRAQDQSDDRAVVSIANHKRSFWIEDTASWEAHDVVQKSHGAGDGAVLVVDVGIHVVAVGSGDDGGRTLKFFFAPAPQLELGGNRLFRRDVPI